MRSLVLITLLAALAVPSTALAWGHSGHRFVGLAAARAFPAEVPAFLRTRDAVTEIGELSREADRTKDAGKAHDQEAQSGHFVDIDEDGRVLFGPPLAPIPPTRQDYEKALQGFGLDSWKAGYLQYSIIDTWQALAMDFAYWRALNAAEKNPKWRKHRAWFAADRRRRESLIMKRIGDLSHFGGDGAQPLHATYHYNGWGDYPNPKGYSQARGLHARFEGELVNESVTLGPVEAAMTPLKVCGCAIEQRVADYLLSTSRQVEPLYDLEKAGGLAEGDARGAAFATRQIAVGASEVRDMVVEAWRASLNRKVGWRPVAVKDVIAGAVDDPYISFHGVD